MRALDDQPLSVPRSNDPGGRRRGQPTEPGADEVSRISAGNAPADWRSRSAMAREALLLGGLYVFYDLVRGMVGGGLLRAQRDGEQVLGIERRLGIDPEHWFNDHLQQATALAVLACFIYATLHFIVTPAVLIWVYRFRHADYPAVRAVAVVTTALALVGFWAFPAAPPRLLPLESFHDTMSNFSSWGWWGNAGAHGPTGSIENEFAAMPSLHVAWAAWCGATIYRYARRRWVRLLALAYLPVTALVVLATANHYLLDVVAGIALWFVVDRAMGVVYGGGRPTDSSDSAPSDVRAPVGTTAALPD